MGGGAFGKFLAPWGGPCKKMKPDWDKLAKDFKSSQAVTIADVDCTDEANGAPVCQRFGVKGYPTLKYFLPGKSKSGMDYQGAREYAGMKQFAEQTFKKPCNVETGDGCAPNELEFIKKNEAKSAEEIKEERTTREEELKDIRKQKANAEAEHKKKVKDWEKR